MHSLALEDKDKPKEKSLSVFLCRPVVAPYGNYDPGASDAGVRAAELKPVDGHGC